MILCEFTGVGQSMVRMSTQDIALTYQWYSYLRAIASIKIALPKKHGGFAAPDFSDIDISPAYFKSIGGYPATAHVKLIDTETNEADGRVIYDGEAYLDSFDRGPGKYVLSKPEMTATIPASTAFNDTLVNVVTALCGPTFLNITLDTTLARSPSPAVLHTTTSDQLAIDLLSGMCDWFCHAARFENDTLYLVDLLGTWAPKETSEHFFQPSSYQRGKKYATYKSGDETLSGTGADEYDAGGPYHTATANIQAALANIKTVIEMDTAIIRYRSDQNSFSMLDKITALDESLPVPVTTTGIITTMLHNDDGRAVDIEVVGSVAV